MPYAVFVSERVRGEQTILAQSCTRKKGKQARSTPSSIALKAPGARGGIRGQHCTLALTAYCVGHILKYLESDLLCGQSLGAPTAHTVVRAVFLLLSLR